jgi:hypothetical protein
LRGLLGHGLILHCLSKRHRVNYGTAPEVCNYVRVYLCIFSIVCYILKH